MTSSARTPTAADIVASEYSSDSWPDLAGTWDELLPLSDVRSFFLTTEWTGAWLETFGDRLDARVLVFSFAGKCVGAALITRRSVTAGLSPIRRIHLHTSGEPIAEGVAVEHVSLLAEPACRAAVMDSFGHMLAGFEWDELVLNGVTERDFEELQAVIPDVKADVEWRTSYLVDLARLRADGKPYENVLSSNTRRQLRRCRALYATRGPISLDFAKSPDEALSMMSELRDLHQKRWSGRGEAGAFASARTRLFHERLIRAAFPKGLVQLARVRAGPERVGLLYSFLHDGVVSFYQSGFEFEADNRLKPGLLTHGLVIQACLDAGLNTYDFLASGPDGSRYKSSMATSEIRLAWATLRRPTLRTRAYLALRHLKRSITGARDQDGD